LKREDPDPAGVGFASQRGGGQFELHPGGRLVDERVAGPPRDAAHPAGDPPAGRCAQQRVVIPASAVPERVAAGGLADQAPAAVAEAVRAVAVDVNHMGRHGVLSGVERIVKRREVGLELFAIGPVRRCAVVGIHVGGEDPVE